jgi:hypothetical protein
MSLSYATNLELSLWFANASCIRLPPPGRLQSKTSRHVRAMSGSPRLDTAPAFMPDTGSDM